MKSLFIYVLFFNFIQYAYGDSTLATENTIDTKSKTDIELKYPFTCEGIYLIDNGMALDRTGLFFDLNSKNLICTYGMMSECAVPKKGQSCICPPVKWVDGGCWKKYSEFQRIKSIKDREWHDKNFKK